ncbi:MAG: gluconate 2-dehydrogenase subunit 3 family protein [Acidobacteriaceae bacterium]|nr:gluconate 2-dehydrogenase subunit 3 family protein [Acidobacteriaceae bacterium]
MKERDFFFSSAAADRLVAEITNGGQKRNMQEKTPAPHMSSSLTRRKLMTGLGTGSVVMTVGGMAAHISSAADGPESTAMRHLNAAEFRTLEALGETLLPGAADAGIACYVDEQLGRSVPLLFLKYTDYAGSLIDFYKQGLRAVDETSNGRYGRIFAELDAVQQFALIRDVSQNTPPGWNGPPAPLFYFVIRNDAADVYYGTPEGFEKLGVPYMPLNRPPTNW